MKRRPPPPAKNCPPPPAPVRNNQRLKAEQKKMIPRTNTVKDKATNKENKLAELKPKEITETTPMKSKAN